MTPIITKTKTIVPGNDLFVSMKGGHKSNGNNLNNLNILLLK